MVNSDHDTSKRSAGSNSASSTHSRLDSVRYSDREDRDNYLDAATTLPGQTKSISLQQAIRVIAVSLVLGILGTVFSIYTEVSQQKEVLAREGSEIAHIAASRALRAVTIESAAVAQSVTSDLTQLENVRGAEILLPNGKMLGTKISEPSNQDSLAQWLGRSLFSGVSVSEVNLFIENKRSGSPVGTLRIHLDREAAGAYFIEILIARVATDILQVTLIGLILAMIFHRFLSQPLVEIRRRISTLNLEDPEHAAIPIPRGHEHNEIGGVVTHINQMLVQLTEGQKDLNRVATRDSLTGLPNRSLIMEMLEHAVSLAKSEREMIAVFFLDIDRFKGINDTLGYEVGDQLLKAVSQRFSSILRSNEWIGRLTADEFLVIAENVHDFDQATAVAKRLERALTASFRIGKQNIHVDASIGIAIYPDDGQEAMELIREADVAMIAAKNSTGTLQFFSTEMRERLRVRMNIETKLRKAIEREEFSLFFQPKINTLTGRFWGCEALIRWSHEGEVIPPDHFIPIAEEANLILPIGEWVLSEACRHIAEWQRRGYRVPMAVNVSARQVTQGVFVQYVKACVDAHGVDPELLELEITETAVMERIDLFREVFAELRRYGVRVSIDDFGMGYSSLAYLRDLTVDVIKIDKHFITSLPEDGKLAEVIITLGHQFGFKVVAEGVETDAQFQWLKAKKCDLTQGYLFSAPLAVDQLEDKFLAKEAT